VGLAVIARAINRQQSQYTPDSKRKVGPAHLRPRISLFHHRLTGALTGLSSKRETQGCTHLFIESYVPSFRPSRTFSTFDNHASTRTSNLPPFQPEEKNQTAAKHLLTTHHKQGKTVLGNSSTSQNHPDNKSDEIITASQQSRSNSIVDILPKIDCESAKGDVRKKKYIANPTPRARHLKSFLTSQFVLGRPRIPRLHPMATANC
jgi:hypothetical protein